MATVHLDIPYYPFPYQQELHLDTERFKMVIGGRRVGKSAVALQELIKHCLTTPDAVAWWISQTYKDAHEIGWESFRDLMPTLSPVIKSANLSTLTIKFINGARLSFKGSDNENSLRGRGITYVVLDEAAFIKEDVWTKIIRPALSDKKGRALFTTTPNGRNWLYHVYLKATYISNPAWKAYSWPTSLNPLIDDQEIADARANLCDIDYRQEYLAEFVTKAGMIYDDFNDQNIIEPFSPNTQLQSIYLGMDFGFANPTAITFMAIDNSTLNVSQFDEIYVARTPMETIQKKLHQTLGKHGLSQQDVRYIYTDPAGNADELSSGISPVDYLRKLKWKVDNKGTLVAPGLALVRSFVLNASGQRRYFIAKNCIHTIASMYGYSYKLGLFKRVTEEPDKDNIHDHACDAVRYFFVNRYDNAKYIFSDLGQQPFHVDTKPKPSIMKRCSDCRRSFISKTAKHEPPHLCKECMNARTIV